MIQRTSILLVILLALSSCEFWEVDKCLDKGGRWNYETKECEYQKSPQPEPTENRHTPNS